MNDVFEQIEIEERELWSEYRAMTRRQGEGRKWSLKDNDRLKFLAERLRIPKEQGQGDLQTVRDVIRLREGAGRVPEARERLRAAEAAEVAFRVEKAEAEAALNRKLVGLRGDVMAATSALNQAQVAADKVAELEALHWRLLDCPDPAELAKRRHIVARVFGEYPDDGRSIEQVMIAPELYGAEFPGPYRWEAAPGQTPEECARLLELAGRITRSPSRRFRYLLLLADKPRVASEDMPIIFVDHGRPIDLSVPWERVEFVPAPGQGREQLAELAEKFNRRLARERKADHQQRIVGPGARVIGETDNGVTMVEAPALVR